jgi:GT2 family glycosyltransferase/glycosyltransferase involved in cell wall biosynthesis/SAM-dependent methyltransferase
MATTLNRANLLFRQKRYSDAIELYKRVADEQPSLTKIIEFNIKAASQKLKLPISIESKSRTINKIDSVKTELYLDKAKNIRLPKSRKPVVSVIIPIYGQIDYTLKCLQSIADNTPQTDIEILIVDDCSPDESVNILKMVIGLRLIKNNKNHGFIRSCNHGAQNAQGEYLLFLNNDTEVTPDWLDELHRTFLEFPGTGLAGSKLIYPDGRLQEAGGIIWQDGSAWNFGRLQDSKLPLYNYAREVDYCSGASIMVPKSLFNELGGFDEHYLPAYCEDSDLALKIREKGYRIIYQPLSSVIHYEGITSGTDLNSGVKSYQIENTKKLYERWKERLNKHQQNGQNVDDAKDRRANKRVLVLDHSTPTPDQDSGSIDAYNQMILLREMDFQVTFIPEDNFLYMPKYTTALQRIGVEVLYAPYVTSVEQHVRDHGLRYDLVFIARPGAFERQIDLIRKCCRKAKVIFHTVDLHFLRMQREAELLNSDDLRKKAQKFKQKEISLIAKADVTTVLSEEELKIVKKLVPQNKIELLPYARSVRGTTKTFNERKDIVFIGGYQHTPNVDAVKYFINKIMPEIRKELPSVCFHVVGSNPPVAIRNLASTDVIVHGYIEDLSEFLDFMRISVAPLRYGAGIKGKIGTSMAVGLPVVATSLAIEGMGLEPDKNIIVSDDAVIFAKKIISLYKEKKLWDKFSQESISTAEEKWGPKSSYLILKNIMHSLGLDNCKLRYQIKFYDYIYKHNSIQQQNDKGKRQMMDGNYLLQEANLFNENLQRIKKQLDSEFPWYPYGTLNNFVHLRDIFNNFNLDKITEINSEVLDIGGADGDLAFFFEKLGFKVTLIDKKETNFNQLNAVNLLKKALNSNVQIQEVDLDSMFNFADKKYKLVIFLGVLYHLKNPFYILEKLSRQSDYLLISTRVAKYSPDGVNISDLPVSYLVAPDETNNDPTNYWIFSNVGLKRLFERTGWEIVGLSNVGDTLSSNPRDSAHDERTFALLKNKFIA